MSESTKKTIIIKRIALIAVTVIILCNANEIAADEASGPDESLIVEDSIFDYDYRDDVQVKYDKAGLRWRLNPIDDSESWMLDPAQDLASLEAAYSSRLAAERTGDADALWHADPTVREMAVRTGGYPTVSELSPHMHIMNFNAPPLQLSEDGGDDRGELRERLTVAALSGVEPLVQAACVKNPLAYNGFTALHPSGRRARTVLYAYYDFNRVGEEFIQVNWMLGFDDRWHIVNTAYSTPCFERTFEATEPAALQTRDNLNDTASAETAALFGAKVAHTELLQGHEARWICREEQCFLSRGYEQVLAAGSFDPDLLWKLCQSGSQVREDERAAVTAYFSYADDSLISCAFEPYERGNASGTINVTYAEPYNTSLVTTPAWYGTIHDAAGNPLDALNTSGQYDNVNVGTAMFTPAPDQTLHAGHSFPKRTYHIYPDPSMPPDGAWAFPTFTPGGTNTFSLANTNLDAYDRGRIMAHTWVEWLLQLTLDTTGDIKGGLNGSGEPNYGLGLMMCGGCNSHVPVDGYYYSIRYNASNIGTSSAGSGDSDSIGEIIHEFEHTLAACWELNITSTRVLGLYFNDEMNESAGDTYAALLTKGQNCSAGRYTSFKDIVIYSKYPGGDGSEGGDQEHQEWDRMGRVLDVTNYQINVLGYQIGWDALLYAAFYPNTMFNSANAITGWADTGSLQAAFPTYAAVGPYAGYTEKTFLDLAEENLRINGYTGYRPIAYNHFNRTATLTYESPDYDRDGIGNGKRWSQTIIWPSTYSSSVYFTTKPNGATPLDLTPGSGDEEDYDYFQFYAPSGVQFDLTMDTNSSTNADYKISLHNENGTCLVGPGCTTEPSSCGADKACILNWLSTSSQLYYFRVWNAYNTNELEPSYTITLSRDGDREADNAWGSEPTYLNNDAYLLATLDDAADVDYFRVVIPGTAWYLFAYTCTQGGDTPYLNLTLYNSTWESSRLTQYQTLATSTSYDTCGANHAQISYMPNQPMAPGVYFIKATYRGAGTSSGQYRLYVKVYDQSPANKVVDEDAPWAVPMESLQSSSSGSFQMLRGYLSGTANTNATNYCTQPYPVASAVSSPCPDQADFYRVTLTEGQYLNVGSRGGVEVSVWAVSTIHDARYPYQGEPWSPCTDAYGVGCAPLVVDDSYAVNDSPTSGEVTFVAPVAGSYDIRVVNKSTSARHYTLLLHKQPSNLSWTTTPVLNYPSTYTR